MKLFNWIFTFLTLFNSKNKIWVDNSFKECSKNKSSFYMVIVNKEYESYKVNIYTKDNILRAVGYFINNESNQYLVEDGLFIFYYPNGNIESHGFYNKGFKDGLWVRFDKDGNKLASKIYDSNFTRKYYE